MNEIEKFAREVEANIKNISNDVALHSLSLDWINAIVPHKYTYNFSWLGRPIIQLPPDIVAIQELIWSIKPDLVIETGIAHGGSLILSASILAMLDYADAVSKNKLLDPKKPKRMVLGIDIDIRQHNRKEIEDHPLSNGIKMLQGSSIDPKTIETVNAYASNFKKVLVLLDSNHTHEHVLAELNAYGPMTSVNSYCVVFDTIVETIDEEFKDRPWGKGNNPKTAVDEFIKNCEIDAILNKNGKNLKFEVDRALEHKLLLTVAPGGFLKRTQ